MRSRRWDRSVGQLEFSTKLLKLGTSVRQSVWTSVVSSTLHVFLEMLMLQVLSVKNVEKPGTFFIPQLKNGTGASSSDASMATISRSIFSNPAAALALTYGARIAISTRQRGCSDPTHITFVTPRLFSRIDHQCVGGRVPGSLLFATTGTELCFSMPYSDIVL
ncbi:hypothetical protein SDRG_11143 [Saprolegnia diclina VS20]|uniref:Uncharacterized protein n=1 Tax=Saprolegnia diclina (strain VS20) TaxID=1156394 RepID=T0QCD5_SAPDV|nr:hypothetical protein SDRG_11143 [Saprolegnia diclina VS20]EQC31220.1 hypothetical protein SDRG_11143 [Saprolegnia diclina VS20]|eukprot:XP_008615393.1 hypothetical protein SDRG_11143 [Saprolegnia diclina VS20]